MEDPVLVLFERGIVDCERLWIAVEQMTRLLDQRLIDLGRAIALREMCIPRDEPVLQLLALRVRLRGKGTMVAQLLNDAVLLRRIERHEVFVKRRALVRRVEG